jgi:hypothetical protein
MGEAEAKAEAEGPGRGEARSWSLPVAVGALEGRRAGGWHDHIVGPPIGSCKDGEAWRNCTRLTPPITYY